jgi:hypothetical protein
MLYTKRDKLNINCALNTCNSLVLLHEVLTLLLSLEVLVYKEKKG